MISLIESSSPLQQFMQKFVLVLILCVLTLLPNNILYSQEIPPEFQIKRKENFEFSKAPSISTSGANISIEFETKDFCDATVVIEDNEGNIVRHLVSGVLGKNAPEPFQKDSLAQNIIWDKKNETGKYVDTLENLSVRVSLGLKPMFEKTLFWSPYKRVGLSNGPRFGISPDGVFIADGTGIDSLRKYNHDGVYEKTIYPLSKNALSKNTKGLRMEKFPQDGAVLPIKHGPKCKSTFFTYENGQAHDKYGTAANVIAVCKDQIALVAEGTSRLTTKGEINEAGLNGPTSVLKIQSEKITKTLIPLSVAFSNDGRWLYSTGYRLAEGQYGVSVKWLPVVMRVEFNSNNPAEVFIGDLKYESSGSGDGKFKAPLGVAVDPNGNILVADYMNDRIQVFNPEGKFLKAVPVEKPVVIGINPKDNQLFVSSWMINNNFFLKSTDSVLPKFTRYGSLDALKIEFQGEIPFKDYAATPATAHFFELVYQVAFDFWAPEPRIWVLPGAGFQFGHDSSIIKPRADLKGVGVMILKEQDKKLVKMVDFNDATVKDVVRPNPPHLIRQRMYVHPITGMLYLGESDSGEGKSFKEIVSINPNNHEIKIIKLPFSTEDMCIDMAGFFYLRSEYNVIRCDPNTWKEIPFDYGVESPKVGFCTTAMGGPMVSVIDLPATGKGDNWWHLGGFSVAPNGDLAVSCYNIDTSQSQAVTSEVTDHSYKSKDKTYTPVIYPGRRVNWEIHIWDKLGKVKYQDAFPGVYVSNGIYIDKNDSLYVLMDQNRMIGDKPYLIDWASTMVKVKPSKAKVLSTDSACPVPLAKAVYPKRGKDLTDGWVENAEWLYGGVGFSGWRSGASCICFNARPALDLLGRSFVPEIDHYSVAVLDTNGNLILRIGQYGNVDDGKPLIPDNGPKNPTSIGGDEVALFHAPYLATFSDHRLFISDGGNSRIISVKLDYHNTQKIKLK